MADINKLKKSVEHFRFYSRPSNASSDSACTNADLNKEVNNVSNLFTIFIKKLEKDN